ncbi:Dabb family protein [Nocardia alni]|uniref:Dabb family protein n=1 Tax=Nocardia alni TaxID=2815723 RepID=UPI0027E0583E|nr:Dabb family protein [Nocardia alni]
MTRWVMRTASNEVTGRPGGVREWSAGADLPGSLRGRGRNGDFRAEALPPALAGADAVALQPIFSGHRPLRGKRVKRTLLLRVRAGTPEDVVARFEAELAAMPDLIRTIHSWALSRADPAIPGASTMWTHVFEQEFADLDGLTGEYLLHPYHWTCVDRWFDGENPASIVEPGPAHLIRWAPGEVLR